MPVELMNTVRADRDGVWDTLADPAAAARWLRAARPEVAIGIAGWEAVAELRDLRDALRVLAAATTGDDRESAVATTPGSDGESAVATITGGDRESVAASTGGGDRESVAASTTGGDRESVAASTTADDREPAAASSNPATAADRPPLVSAADVDAAVNVVNRACARAPSWSELRWPGEESPAGTASTAAVEGNGPARVVRTAHAPALAVVAAIAEEAVALFAGPDRLLLRACRAPGCVLYFVRNHPRRAWCSDGCGNRARVARHYQRHHGSGREDD